MSIPSIPLSSPMNVQDVRLSQGRRIPVRFGTTDEVATAFSPKKASRFEAEVDKILASIGTFFSPLGEFIDHRTDIADELRNYRGLSWAEQAMDRIFPERKLPPSLESKKREEPLTAEEKSYLGRMSLRSFFLQDLDSIQSIFWSILGSKMLVQATHHLNPEHKGKRTMVLDPEISADKKWRPTKLPAKPSFFIKFVFKTTPYGQDQSHSLCL